MEIICKYPSVVCISRNRVYRLQKLNQFYKFLFGFGNGFSLLLFVSCLEYQIYFGISLQHELNY
jgi:hypothetical protein